MQIKKELSILFIFSYPHYSLNMPICLKATQHCATFKHYNTSIQKTRQNLPKLKVLGGPIKKIGDIFAGLYNFIVAFQHKFTPKLTVQCFQSNLGMLRIQI